MCNYIRMDVLMGRDVHSGINLHQTLKIKYAEISWNGTLIDSETYHLNNTDRRRLRQYKNDIVQTQVTFKRANQTSSIDKEKAVKDLHITTQVNFTKNNHKMEYTYMTSTTIRIIAIWKMNEKESKSAKRILKGAMVSKLSWSWKWKDRDNNIYAKEQARNVLKQDISERLSFLERAIMSMLTTRNTEEQRQHISQVPAPTNYTQPPPLIGNCISHPPLTTNHV